MQNSACFIFFTGPSITLGHAARELTECGMQVVERDGELAACFPEGPVLRVALVSEPYVREEAVELSEGSAHAHAMSRCDRRFEILIDDLDATLDEINTLIDVQSALQELTHGFLFLTWNGELSAYEE